VAAAFPPLLQLGVPHSVLDEVLKHEIAIHI
jgi:hypothetical protein